MTIGLDTIDQLTGRRLGTFDVPCPECGPFKRMSRNQRKRVLRIWRSEPGYATFHCARCSEHGFARDRNSAPPDPVKVAKARAAATERDRVIKAERAQPAAHHRQHRRAISARRARLRRLTSDNARFPAGAR